MNRKLLPLLAVLSLPLAACGSVEPQQVDIAPGGFQTVFDGDREFRCLTQWEKQGYGGGLAMWCYEVTP